MDEPAERLSETTPLGVGDRQAFQPMVAALAEVCSRSIDLFSDPRNREGISSLLGEHSVRLEPSRTKGFYLVVLCTVNAGEIPLHNNEIHIPQNMIPKI